MKKSIIGILTTVVLVAIMAANAFMLIRIWMLMSNDGAVLRENKASYTFPDGYTPEGTKLSWNESLPAPSGWVVRYASNGCIYCKLDFEWERLAHQLERNYRIITLLPNEESQFAKDQMIPENAQQLVFIKMDWIKQFRFTGTPTTIIFDNNGRMIWHHQGMLGEDDYNLAKKLL